MNALRIVKTYPDYPNGKPDEVQSAFYRWVCEKVKLNNFDDLELSMPFYRKRDDIIVAVKTIDDLSNSWCNANPLASELFKSMIIGDCFITFDNIKSNEEFDLWCNIIKADLKTLGCGDKSFAY